MSKFIINLKDAEKLRFSQPYLKLDTVFLVNRRQRAMLKVQDRPLKIAMYPQENPWQKEKIILGTIDNSMYYTPLERSFPGNTVIRIADPEKLISMVASGKIFACYVDEAQAKTYFQRHPEQAVAIAYLPALTDSASIALAFSWKNEALREWSNIFLQQSDFPAIDLDKLIKEK